MEVAAQRKRNPIITADMTPDEKMQALLAESRRKYAEAKAIAARHEEQENAFAKAMFRGVMLTAAAKHPPQEGDYKGDDGLLFCGKCHTPKEKRVAVLDEVMTVRCACKCAEERFRQKQAQEAAEKRRERAERFRERGNVSPECRFEYARMTPEMRTCQRYAEKWDDVRQKNIGLFLWGDVGAGKTFAANCICNALIERDEPVSVLITSLAAVLNSGWDKTETVERVRSAGLVVFDDLGVERSSDYALENAFVLFDERCKARKPLIVTSNLTLDDIKNPVSRDAKSGMEFQDIRRKRIYDRIQEMCVAIQFGGNSKRREINALKRRDALELLN